MLLDHLLYCLYRSLMHRYYIALYMNNFSNASGLLLANIHYRGIF